MPEGPSIIILKELVQDLRLEGETILEVRGDAAIDQERFLQQKVVSFKSWGKYFLICFNDCCIRIHLMMFGTYRINERKETPVRLGISFRNAELNFYTCSVKVLEGKAEDHYDWSADIMSEQWNEKSAEQKLMLLPSSLICDVLLNQGIFSGVGNIIKNEVLYRTAIHPLNTVRMLPENRRRAMISEVRTYSYDFLRWKKEGILKRNWLIYTRARCPENHAVAMEYLGKIRRRTFYCVYCQKFHGTIQPV